MRYRPFSFHGLVGACLVAMLLGACNSDEPEAPADGAPKSADAEPAVKEDVPSTPTDAPAESEISEVALADSGSAGVGSQVEVEMKKTETPDQGNVEIATIGGGCFWCTEAVLERIEGVKDVVSGYMGGHVDNPTYAEVCGMRTGHAEVIQVTYDPAAITFEDILDIFWQAHDPTTINRQGNDRGPQYRSVIFYHTPEQKNIAEASKKKADSSGKFEDPIVTEITEASTFWPAEEEHQDYYSLNKDKNPYCPVVITPKLKKLGLE